MSIDSEGSKLKTRLVFQSIVFILWRHLGWPHASLSAHRSPLHEAFLICHRQSSALLSSSPSRRFSTSTRSCNRMSNSSAPPSSIFVSNYTSRHPPALFLFNKTIPSHAGLSSKYVASKQSLLTSSRVRGALIVNDIYITLCDWSQHTNIHWSSKAFDASITYYTVWLRSDYWQCSSVAPLTFDLVDHSQQKHRKDIPGHQNSFQPRRLQPRRLPYFLQPKSLSSSASGTVLQTNGDRLNVQSRQRAPSSFYFRLRSLHPLRAISTPHCKSRLVGRVLRKGWIRMILATSH